MTIVRMQQSACIYGSVRASEKCIVIGWPIHIEGRKHVAGSTVYSEAGKAVATGRSTWIKIPESEFPAERAE